MCVSIRIVYTCDAYTDRLPGVVVAVPDRLLCAIGRLLGDSAICARQARVLDFAPVVKRRPFQRDRNGL